MKITIRELQKIIKEEIEYALLEESVQLDEAGIIQKMKRAVAGLGAGLAMMGAAGKAQAAPITTSPASPVASQKAAGTVTDDDKNVMVGLINDYQNAKAEQQSVESPQEKLKIKAKYAEEKMDAIKFVRSSSYKGQGGNALIKGAFEIMKQMKDSGDTEYKAYLEKGKSITVN